MLGLQQVCNMDDGVVQYASDGCNILDKIPQQWNRRALRKALRTCDVNKIQSIIAKGYDVNAAITDVHQDTALIWSVKNGHLEMVEFLVKFPGCDIEKKDRNQHSPLDEAIKKWLGVAVVGASSDSNHDPSVSSNGGVGAPQESNSAAANSSDGTTDSMETDIINLSEVRDLNYSSAVDTSANGTVCGLTASKNDSRSSGGVSRAKGALKVHVGVRYRILKCLLEAGASSVSATHLDMAVFQTLTSLVGDLVLMRLCKLVADKGHRRVPGVLLSVLVTYRRTYDCLGCLVEAGAEPQYYLTKEPSRPFMPVENALLLLRVCNDDALLSRIECDTTGNLTRLNEEHINQLVLVLRLLVVCGHSLQLYVMNFLREHRLHFYMWVVHYTSNPPALQCLCRIVIRRSLRYNVMYCYDKITALPGELKQFLLFSEWLVPKKKQTFGQ